MPKKSQRAEHNRNGVRGDTAGSQFSASEFETLLLTLSNNFIHLGSESIDEGVNYALQKIGEFCQVDRSWIIEFNEAGGTATNTYEWCAEGIEPGIDQIQDFPVSEVPWFMSKLRNFETIHIPSLDTLPPEAMVERQICEAQGVKSSISVPLIYSKNVIGIVGFDSVRAEKFWPSEILSLLNIVGEMLVNAIARKKEGLLRKESDTLFKSVCENLAEGLVIGDMQDRVLYVNSRLADMLGYSVEDLTGTFAYRKLVPEEQWHKVEGGTTRRRYGEVDRYELTLKRKDGESFPTEVSATPYRNAIGEIIGSIATITDISSRKLAEQENSRLQRQLLQAQKMEAVGQLAAGIAHDLNNALGAVVGHLQLIRMSENLNPQMLQSVTVALEGCDRASSLIGQLLSFSRQGKYNLQNVSIHQIVRDTVEFLGKVVSKNVEIKRSGQLEDLHIVGDPAQLQQAFTNLIINAGQAMPSGGTVNFSFSTTHIIHPQSFNPKAKSGNYVVLTVSDTGAGIEPELLPKIFDPFFTTKKEGEGSGLGLSMVYAIITKHGGWIEVDSAVGMGTAFTIYLPQAHAPVLSLAEDRKETRDTPAGPYRATVLVIDDEQVLGDLACNFLNRAGFDTRAFSEPDAAFQWYRDHFMDVALILLDMKMPGYNGQRSFKIIKEINPDAQVVLISGFIEDSEVHDLLDAGAISFIQKPVKYSELVDFVSRTLNSQKGRPPLRAA